MDNIVKFAKPYSFEGTEYTEVDLSGMDKLTIQDMIDIQKNLANELASLAALEATTSFAQEMATKASGKPVEFFKLMPRAKIKQVQTAILLSLNAKTKISSSSTRPTPTTVRKKPTSKEKPLRASICPA